MHISSGDLLHRRGAADGFNSQRRLLGATAQHRPEVSEPTQYANRHTGYAQGATVKAVAAVIKMKDTNTAYKDAG